MIPRAFSVILLVAVGCAGTGGVQATLRSPETRCGDRRARPGWAWIKSWRKAIEENNVGMLASLASPDADFRVYVCNSEGHTMEKLTVSRAEWLRDARNSYSSEDDCVKIGAAGDSGPVAEIRGWDTAGEWRYSIVASLKDSAHGTMKATKMGLFRFPPREP